jgi:hypothetical protein
LYLEKKFPAPFSIGLFYRTRFAGKNNALRTTGAKKSHPGEGWL